MPDTVTISKPKLKPQRDTAPDRGWKVILFNDDVTPLQLVVLALQQVAGLSLEVADMVAAEAHEHGQAVVRRGLLQEDAERIALRLHEFTCMEGVSPGVHAEAQEDDA